MLNPWNLKQRNAKIIDMSHYDIMPDFAELVRGGVDGVIFKDDAMTEVHVARARAAGLLPLGLYGWADPNYNGKEQALRFIQHLEKFQVSSGWMDAEQEYKYFSEYLAYLQGKMRWVDVKKIPQADIRRVFMDYQDTLDEWGMDTKHITGMYSRDELLKRIFANDKLWLASKRHWGALYTYYPSQEVTFRSYSELWVKEPGKAYENYLRDPIVNPMLWQWTGDRALVPGVKIPIDANIMRGSVEEMYAYFGIEGKPEPAPVNFRTAHLKPRYSALNARPGPADWSRVVRILHKNETMMLSDEVHTITDDETKKVMVWVKLWNEDAWINQAYIDIDQ